DADRAILERYTCTVRGRAGRGHADSCRRDLPCGVDVVRGVVHVHRMRAFERVRAAREVTAQLQGEIERDASRDVGRTGSVVQPPGEIYLCDVERASPATARYRCVGRKVPSSAPAGTAEPDVGAQPCERTFQSSVE